MSPQSIQGEGQMKEIDSFVSLSVSANETKRNESSFAFPMPRDVQQTSFNSLCFFIFSCFFHRLFLLFD